MRLDAVVRWDRTPQDETIKGKQGQGQYFTLDPSILHVRQGRCSLGEGQLVDEDFQTLWGTFLQGIQQLL